MCLCRTAYRRITCISVLLSVVQNSAMLRPSPVARAASDPTWPALLRLHHIYNIFHSVTLIAYTKFMKYGFIIYSLTVSWASHQFSNYPMSTTISIGPILRSRALSKNHRHNNDHYLSPAFASPHHNTNFIKIVS